MKSWTDWEETASFTEEETDAVKDSAKHKSADNEDKFTDTDIDSNVEDVEDTVSREDDVSAHPSVTPSQSTNRNVTPCVTNVEQFTNASLALGSELGFDIRRLVVIERQTEITHVRHSTLTVSEQEPMRIVERSKKLHV